MVIHRYVDIHCCLLLLALLHKETRKGFIDSACECEVILGLVLADVKDVASALLFLYFEIEFGLFNKRWLGHLCGEGAIQCVAAVGEMCHLLLPVNPLMVEEAPQRSVKELLCKL